MFFSFILISCEQDLLETPSFKSRGSYSTGSVEAPTNVNASQGGYRSINLSWTAAKNANQYYIYSCDTETGSFQKIAETTDSICNITLSEVPDILKYYKICTVDYDGIVSPFSSTCFGSTMATPIVTSVTQSANGNSITVKWYKGVNCSEKTYLNSDLIYTLVLYSSDGKTVLNEVSLVATDENVKNSASYTFYNLQANTEYFVQIKSHLKQSQGSVELSDIVNKSTAHSLIPAAVDSFTVEKGLSSSSVKLSWRLPKFAEVKTGDTYAARPVYFRIYRKGYDQPESAYSLLVSYFGTNPTKKNTPISGSDSIITFSCLGDGGGDFVFF